MASERKVSFGKRLRYRIDAGLLFSLVWFFQRLGLDRGSAVGGWLGRKALGPLLRKPAELETIRIAFPELGDAEVARIRDDMWENIGRVVAEIAMLEKFGGEAGKARFTFEGLENLEAARATGKEPIMVSGHFANWELAFVVLRHVGLDCAGVTRPPNNPWVADFIAERRSAIGFRNQIPKGAEGTRRLFATVRQGKSIGMLIDQHLAEGIPAPLFGFEAMTTHAPATFSRKLKVPIVPFAVRRTEGAHFHAIFYPAITATDTGNAERDILQMTTALNRFVEDEVRAAPPHWLWMHKRFKSVSELSRRATRVVGNADAPDAEAIGDK